MSATEHALWAALHWALKHVPHEAPRPDQSGWVPLECDDYDRNRQACEVILAEHNARRPGPPVPPADLVELTAVEVEVEPPTQSLEEFHAHAMNPPLLPGISKSPAPPVFTYGPGTEERLDAQAVAPSDLDTLKARLTR